MKIKQRQQEEEKRRQQHRSRRSLRRRQQAGIELPEEAEPSPRGGRDQRRNTEELLVSTSSKEPEQEPLPAQFQKAKPPKTNHKRGRK